jgi:ABC-type cobalamin/Fe3+-siderophores transport system ATPase subunit
VGQAVLVLRCVDKAFGVGRRRRGVLAGVSLELGAGEVGAVVASRAQGKTTLLRVVAGMLPVDGGEVLFVGRDLGGLSDADRERLLGAEIGWACRTGPGRMAFNVGDYVGLQLIRGRRLRSRGAGERTHAVLERMGVAGCLELPWAGLSDWERVCVELAQAVVCEPRLLLVDDLLAGLSMGHTREAMRLIRLLAAEDGMAVLMGCSDEEPAMRAHRIWRLEEGELTLDDEPEHDDRAVVSLPQHRRRNGR